MASIVLLVLEDPEHTDNQSIAISLEDTQFAGIISKDQMLSEKQAAELEVKFLGLIKFSEDMKNQPVEIFSLLESNPCFHSSESSQIST